MQNNVNDENVKLTSYLYDSFLCRLCANENINGSKIFPTDENESDLSQLINKYLPLKVDNDRKLPQLICPGCYIQVEATKQFLDLVVEGQNKLRKLLQIRQRTQQHLGQDIEEIDSGTTVKTYLQTDENVLSSGSLFPPEHSLSLLTEGLKKPKRKRGRPSKTIATERDDNEPQKETKTIPESQDRPEIDNDGRRKRKIRVPTRFQEVVQEPIIDTLNFIINVTIYKTERAVSFIMIPYFFVWYQQYRLCEIRDSEHGNGKELEKIFLEEGVIDEDSASDYRHVKTDPLERNEIIGRLQNKEGDKLGELTVVSRVSNKIRNTHKINEVSRRRKTHECEICGKKFLYYGRYENHKSLHKNGKIQCNSCIFRAGNKISIERHHKVAGDNSLSQLQCELLEKEPQHQEITNAKQYTDDAIIPEANSIDTVNLISVNSNQNKPHNSSGKNSCNVCGKNFTCRQNLDVHMKAVHKNMKPHQCSRCKKAFPYLNSLKWHLLKHLDKNEKLYPCEVCKKMFNHPSSLIYHREAEHNNGQRFVCIKCDKSFKHKQLLQRHQLVHSKERPYRCKQCDASFKTRANLINHKPIHTGEKKYFCSQCGQTFAHKTSLTLHIRWHSGQKPFQCDVCLKSFSQKGNLAEHKRIHTGEKPYNCEHCNRKFTTSSQYKLHMKRHSGERPWRCEFCPKAFLHRDTWKCHTRRHKNEKPYQCEQCFKGFSEQCALKKHERLHTGEKPYICEYCNRGFADCSNLAKHKKIHENEPNLIEAPEIKVLTSSKDDQNDIFYVTLDSNSSEIQSSPLVQILEQLNTKNENEVQSKINNISTNLSTNNTVIQQIIDQEGNSMSVSLPDGQMLKIVTTVENGQQNFKGLANDGTLIPLNVSFENERIIFGNEQMNVTIEEKENEFEEWTNKKKDESKVDSIPLMQFLDSEQILSEQKIEGHLQLLVEGQNVCFVTAYNSDDPTNSQYLATP